MTRTPILALSITAGAETPFAELRDLVLTAEASGVDFIQLGSQTAPDLDETMLASALASETKRIGIVAAADPGDHRPYNLARRFASLDLLTAGRSGWAVQDLSEEDGEYLTVVAALWQSFEPDGFLYDKPEGRVFEPAKMHVLGHEGPRFSVRGPLNVNPSPQGSPLVVIEPCPKTLRLAAGHADVVVFRTGQDGIDAKRIKAMLTEAGRDRAAVRLLEVLSIEQAGHAPSPSGGADGLLLEGSPSSIHSYLSSCGRIGGTDEAMTLRARLGLAERRMPPTGRAHAPHPSGAGYGAGSRR